MYTGCVAFPTQHNCLVRLPSLDRSSGWTTSVFQILLWTQRLLFLGEKQLLTFHIFRFLSLTHEKNTEKLVTIIFEISDLIVGVSLVVYLTLQKLMTPFPIREVKINFLLYNLLQQFSQYAVFMVHLKPRRKIADWLLMYQPRITWLDRWVIPENMYSVTNCQYRTKFSICYLSDNVSTPVFRSSSVIK